MRNKGSKIANYIDQEYRAIKAYERKKRVNCKDKQCYECQYEKICEDRDTDKSNEIDAGILI